MARNPELEARILAHPDDRSAYSVYGDWLSEQGDPRGELVAVQLRLADTPDDPALRDREARLLADHGRAWLGELAALDPEKDFAVTWRYGFVDRARLGPPIEKYATSELDFPDAIATLFALPHIALLRELVIGSKEDEQNYQPSYSAEIEAIAEQGVPAGLRVLRIDRGGFWDISSTSLGDLSPAYPKLGALHELYIEVGSLELGRIELPELRSIEIVTGGLTADNVRSIRTGVLPKLERLLLCIGETGGDHGGDVALDDLGWIFAAEGLAHVRHLGLANSSFEDDIARALSGSKILAQLETLDLSRGTLSDEGAREILDHAGAFAHLSRLDLSRSFLSDDVKAQLAQLRGPRVIMERMESPDDDYRYVAISE